MSASSDAQRLALRLFDAQRQQTAIDRLTLERDISEREAYDIQWALLQLHLAGGARVAGKKTGLTSKAKQVQMNTNEPLYAYLLDRTILNDGAVLSYAD